MHFVAFLVLFKCFRHISGSDRNPIFRISGEEHLHKLQLLWRGGGGAHYYDNHNSCHLTPDCFQCNVILAF